MSLAWNWILLQCGLYPGLFIIVPYFLLSQQKKSFPLWPAKTSWGHGLQLRYSTAVILSQKGHYLHSATIKQRCLDVDVHWSIATNCNSKVVVVLVIQPMAFKWENLSVCVFYQSVLYLKYAINHDAYILHCTFGNIVTDIREK